MRKSIPSILFVFVLVAIFALVSAAFASPKLKAQNCGVQPTFANGEVTIPALPNGSKVVNVYLWNDCLGSDEVDLGPVTSFKLPDPCSSFNFVWEDNTGKKHWQMVTPSTPNAVCHPLGWKYGLKKADVNQCK